jgi:hypothetical protein
MVRLRTKSHGVFKYWESEKTWNVYIRCRGNVFTEPLPSNERDTQTHTRTDTQKAMWTHMPTSLNKESRPKNWKVYGTK